ncbi:MAG: tRNA (adenosine(37)-N6)-threonylcarbamoyltransferase complex dimerization subunit type 1 TsaB [Candidatus Lambdaproteobacteria bacterium]|nr:tRNA (adenosine(37)-N6)-threonylcarbamoyltransferase complex dimerization subunit type 1 TsaB [Candidatus Lambdaproteobacteria bacterium]
MTNALALDTTSDMLSLALLKAGRPAASHYAPCGTRTAQVALEVIDGLLRSAGLELGRLDVLVVARGPGSFTGTRIGLAIALTLGQVTGRPVIGVDSLHVLAAQTGPADPRTFHVVLNCVRDEAYHAPFRWEGGRLRCLAPIALDRLESIAAQVGAAPVVVRRFEPVARGGEGRGGEALLAALTPMALRHPQPDGLRLLAVGLPLYLERPGGPFPRVEPIYLKSEAFRTWQRPA